MKIAVIVLLALILLAVLWDASERHYDSCVHAAEARTSGPTSAFDPAGVDYSGRSEAVAGCSHLP